MNKLYAMVPFIVAGIIIFNIATGNFGNDPITLALKRSGRYEQFIACQLAVVALLLMKFLWIVWKIRRDSNRLAELQARNAIAEGAYYEQLRRLNAERRSAAMRDNQRTTGGN